MTPLAIIPARSGSKRLVGKNLSVIGRKTLIEWAIDSAIDSCMFPRKDRIVLSSDDPGMIKLGNWAGILTLQRGTSLAQDDTPMMDVVRAVVRHLDGDDFDSVVLLQPTSPMRTGEDIATAMRLLSATGGDAVISVTEADLDGAVFEIGHAGRLRAVESEHRRSMVQPNGAIFAITRAALKRGEDWWRAPLVYAYSMPKARSVDIDTAADLEMARAIMENAK